MDGAVVAVGPRLGEGELEGPAGRATSAAVAAATHTATHSVTHSVAHTRAAGTHGCVQRATAPEAHVGRDRMGGRAIVRPPHGGAHPNRDGHGREHEILDPDVHDRGVRSHSAPTATGLARHSAPTGVGYDPASWSRGGTAARHNEGDEDAGPQCDE